MCFRLLAGYLKLQNVLCHTDGIFVRKSELQAENLVFVKRVFIEDFDVHLPFTQIFGLHDRYSLWEGLLHLRYDLRLENGHRGIWNNGYAFVLAERKKAETDNARHGQRWVKYL